MVQFYNINVGAQVEVIWRGEICKGTVRYTGALVAKPGEWIGVELDERVGSHTGLHKGVQYFKCRDGHGIFTRARNVRFGSNRRLLFNSYKTVSPNSSVEETLFRRMDGLSIGVDPVSNETPDPAVISSKYLTSVKTSFKDKGNKDMWSGTKGFHKSHLIGAHIRPATAPQPHTALSTSTQRYKEEKHHFISPPSIPSNQVPRPVLKRMVQQNYFGTTIPRYSSLS